jgi:hypothetical protein
MNRIEFVHSIRSDQLSIADLVVNYFSQYMLLYNLIDYVNDIKVINSNNTAITFELCYTDDTSAQILQNKISGIQSAIVYGVLYYIRSTVKDNLIYVTISR